MADDEPRFTSVAERIAALKLQNAGGSIPLQQPQEPQKTSNGVNGRPRPPPPPPPKPSVPARPNRAQTSSVPPANDGGPSPNRPVGNVPEAGRPRVSATNGTNSVPSRPSSPARTLTQTSLAPALPARTPSGPSPALPPRRPSEAPSQPEYALSRRGSADSTSSVATARSSVSAIANATSYTSIGGERYQIRAPDFDPSSLPALPPKRSREEKEAAEQKYNSARPMRRTASTPRAAQVQEGTTPPPMPVRQNIAQPPLPIRTGSVSNEATAPAEVPRPARAQPPLPPIKVARPPLPTRTATQARADVVPVSGRPQLAAPPKPRVSALSLGFGNKETNAAVPVPVVKLETAAAIGMPPPIPASSKPDLAALQASKPRSNGVASGPAPTPVTGALEITSYAQFSHIISSHRIVVSDFWAPWCGPCRNFAPDYERLAKEHCRPSQIAFIKINTDDNKDIAQAYKIECWPTLIMFQDGREVDKSLGANEYWLTNLVENLARKARINLSAPVAASAAPLPAPANSCLHCRDFSGPDNHAARFPRQSIPSHDVGWLATQLTSPFPSHTDKARAIFTWLHHNVAYNTQAFFSNNVKGSTPQSTLQTGLAVCEGYAGLFAALAVKAGMESVVVTGASKGFGYEPLRPGQPVPPYKSDHAWNVVKIDGGEWKLVDSCWGAGNVDGGTQSYTKHFKPDWFAMSNNEFGLSHYPESSYQQYRTDGRALSWEEFSMANKDGTGALVYNKATEEGLAKTSLCPVDGKINLSQQGPTVRFSFQKICPHWDPIKNGPGSPYLFVLLLDAQKDDREKNCPPFNTNGEVWWCDVPTHHLGRSGQKVMLIGLTEFGGRDGRGLTIQEFQRKKGRSGWASAGIAQWEIA
ncbi:Putative transglutaminase, Thioredoxin domain, Thioredoxin-like superfamily [Septoria linicola]|uniref:Transglutaminase, Thioredoxin domain, Thioredoxin-like superfamily n=1 Tax=Septoria linicola TaxID=215465 RepID=A0A9Q9AI48_9PEZI|nr:putative transglutaminase, Thioredoxin domain, Thioredoxin-like superfamily [Septoria linicola]USW49819.1 Putative transglutaminase, Thioredoxin domain, Thioredoxin-like superfamily [Septoria linicola]